MIIVPVETTTTATGAQDDLSFGGADVLRCDNASLLTIRGLAAGVPGQCLRIVAVGAGQVNFSHQDNNSSANNRLINCATSGFTSIVGGSGSALFQYDGVTQRWRLVQHEQGAFITPTFSAGNFTSDGSTTWTVDSADVISFAYYLRGRSLTVIVNVSSTSISSSGSSSLFVAIPGGFSATKTTQAFARTSDNGNVTTGRIVANTSSTVFTIYNGLGVITAWANSANNTGVTSQINIEVA